MKLFKRMTMLTALAFCMTATLIGQEMTFPKPGPELNALHADVGTWDVEIRTWNDTVESTNTKGTEINRMLGGFWLLSNFRGSTMGMEFQGHGVYSYDAEKKAHPSEGCDESARGFLRHFSGVQ